MNKKVLFLALAIACLLPPASTATAQPDDAALRSKLLGFWRSPRHEYEFKPNGVVYMRPTPPCTTKSPWTVKGGYFFWDEERYTIVTLTEKRFVYKSQDDKSGPPFILNRITAKMVGGHYDRTSIK